MNPLATAAVVTQLANTIEQQDNTVQELCRYIKSIIPDAPYDPVIEPDEPEWIHGRELLNKYYVKN